jgi:hypothetical protein
MVHNNTLVSVPLLRIIVHCAFVSHYIPNVVDVQSDRNSFLIETSGPLDLVRNCFEDNVVHVAPVAIYGTRLLASSNYGLNSTGDLCPLAAAFSTSSSFESFTPNCTDFDASECMISDPNATTVRPSASPTVPPSGAPIRSHPSVPSGPAAPQPTVTLTATTAPSTGEPASVLPGSTSNKPNASPVKPQSVNQITGINRSGSPERYSMPLAISVTACLCFFVL